MSTFVMGNHEIGYAQFGGVHSSQDSSSIKQTFWLKLVKHKKKVTFIAVSIVILVVGLSVLVYFLNKGSSSKLTLPKVKGELQNIPLSLLFSFNTLFLMLDALRKFA